MPASPGPRSLRFSQRKADAPVHPRGWWPRLSVKKTRRKVREMGGWDARPNTSSTTKGTTPCQRSPSSPSIRPTSNAKTREMLKEGAGQIPQLADQLGINISTLRIFGPDHIILAVVETDDIDSVRNFALQSRLMQWNTVRIHATYSMEEALPLIDSLEPIF